MVGVLLVSRDTAWALAVARDPRPADTPLHVVLLDRAAAAARTTHPCAGAVRDAIEAGAAVVVHDEAVQRRAISAADLVSGVKTVDLDEVADLVTNAAGAVMWL